MRIALRGGNIGMTQQLLHIIKRHALIDQSRGKRVAQIMDAHIGQTGFFARHIPWIKNLRIGLACCDIGKNKRTDAIFFKRELARFFKDFQRAFREGNIARATVFRHRHHPCFAFKIHMRPLGMNRLAFARTGDQQKRNDEFQHRTARCRHFDDQPLRLLARQKPIPMRRLAKLPETARRILIEFDQFDLLRIGQGGFQPRQQPIAGGRHIARLFFLLHEAGNIGARNAIQRHVAEHRKQMVAKQAPILMRGAARRQRMRHVNRPDEFMKTEIRLTQRLRLSIHLCLPTCACFFSPHKG